MLKYKSFPKIELHKFFQIKNSKPYAKTLKSLMQRKLVNRQTYEQTIHALDDPCVIYDIASQGV